MHHRTLHWALALLLAAIMAPIDAVARDLPGAARAEAAAQAFFDASGAPGMVVTVGLDGDIAWSKGYGYADLEQAVPADPAATRFRIGSVIKSMTAFAIARLVEQGRIDLDAPIQAYVPTFPVKEAPITTRALLAHLAGIRHYAGSEFMMRERFDSVEASLAIFAGDPLVSPPGEAWNYSSYGYNLLSAVIEGATGQPYLDHMQAQVFETLGMAHTVPDRLLPVIPGRGRYYVRHEGEILNAPEVDNSYKWASGGYIGTSEDLVRFGLAMLEGAGVSAETRTAFWTEQVTSSGEPTGYGLGWRVQHDESGRLWIGHGGGSVGGTTSFWILPESGLVIAVVTNLSSFDFGELLPSLVDIHLDPER